MLMVMTSFCCERKRCWLFLSLSVRGRVWLFVLVTLWELTAFMNWGLLSLPSRVSEVIRGKDLNLMMFVILIATYMTKLCYGNTPKELTLVVSHYHSSVQVQAPFYEGPGKRCYFDDQRRPRTVYYLPLTAFKINIIILNLALGSAVTSLPGC